MKQRYIILILPIFFSVSLIGQEGWTSQSTPYASGLRAVYAIDSLNVWASGLDGLLIHSTDGGATWDSIPNGASRYLTTIEFINADTGFVAGRDSETGTPLLNHLLQRTRDGGQNWEFINLPGGQLNTIFDLDFVEGPPGEPMRGFSVGGLANVWISNDYGETWDRASGDCGEGNFNSCFFADSLTGWFVGTPSNVKPYTIMFTGDGCESFVEQTDPNEIKLNGVCFGSDVKGIAVGNAGIVMYTSDGGAVWETCADEDILGTTWFSVFLTETGKAWAVGQSGRIVYSNDWGHTWELQASGVTDLLSEVYFINDSVGWIVGGQTGSVILHTKNGGSGVSPSGIDDFMDEDGTKYRLEQNYPNPFSSYTQIHYSLGYAGHISLVVYDISGRKIQTLINEFQTAGRHSIHWDGSPFSNGLYFYELNVDQGPVNIKKMMLAR